MFQRFSIQIKFLKSHQIIGSLVLQLQCRWPHISCSDNLPIVNSYTIPAFCRETKYRKINVICPCHLNTVQDPLISQVSKQGPRTLIITILDN